MGGLEEHGAIFTSGERRRPAVQAGRGECARNTTANVIARCEHYPIAGFAVRDGECLKTEGPARLGVVAAAIELERENPLAAFDVDGMACPVVDDDVRGH
jgi:hypothetical protein